MADHPTDRDYALAGLKRHVLRINPDDHAARRFLDTGHVHGPERERRADLTAIYRDGPPMPDASEVVRRISDREGVTVDVVKHRKDKRFHVVLVRDGDQHVYETWPADDVRIGEARLVAHGYRLAKTAYE